VIDETRKESEMDWSIQEIARMTGVTSRTLRHYGDVGLLAPTRVAGGGIRHYDAAALVRLQRILLLRELGIGLPAIAEVLDGQRDDAAALGVHLEWLEREKERLDRQIASVETTLETMRDGRGPMAENMFDGFDHTAHRDEVERRWGADAYATSDAWWREKSAPDQAQWRERAADLAADWAGAAARGIPPSGEEAQRLAERQYAWLTEAYRGEAPGREHLLGLGEMYVTDARFAANYGGPVGAAFVRDAMSAFADRML
jgi:MerR family transcriptional regulator, thiopeptide resistance regulator